ncbi:MAG: hypothetical protein HY985_09315 [Magnetospirillum sp.]|nr:hypothetical protein [Magnetospirillum sp.]
MTVVAGFCLALLLAGPVQAQTDAKPIDPELIEKIRKANAECFACHTEGGLKAPPVAGMDMAKLADLLVDPAVYSHSYHGNMDCKQCHGQGYVPFPHAAGAAKQVSPCEECHAVKVFKVDQQFDKSVHAQNLKGKMSCASCHDPHVAQVAAKIGDPKAIVAQDNAMCLDCHNSDLRFAQFAPEKLSLKRKRPDIDTIHAWLPNTKLHWGAVRCIECHTPEAKTQSHEIVNKDKAQKNCVACHSTASSLKTRLYRHLATAEQQRYGFANSIILKTSYVVGATRHPVVDAAILALVGLTVAGLLGHGMVRLVLAWIRRRRSP